MKVLYLTSTIPDHMAMVLWDGLQELIGEENVVDVNRVSFLHRDGCEAAHPRTGNQNERSFSSNWLAHDLSASRQGRHWEADEKNFDLLVLNASFIMNQGWDAVWTWINYLKPNCRHKVALIEGEDSSRDIVKPCLACKVFRKEVDYGPYPYRPYPLSFAVPQRWLWTKDTEDHRTCDVFFVGNPEVDGCNRWQMMQNVFATSRKHRAVIASRGLAPDVDIYFALLQRSKLALCPSSAAGADSWRTYEAVAMGAIPVFLEYPARVREPWFNEKNCFAGSAANVHDIIDWALAGDLGNMRQNLREHVRQFHTTRYRAQTLLQRMGFIPESELMADCKDILPFIQPGWSGVEVGVADGHSAKAFLDHGVAHMHLVDCWTPYEGYPEQYGQGVYEACMSRLYAYKNKTVYRMYSSQAVSQIPDNLDFAWIDANHCYEWVKGDIEMYWPKIRAGGIFAGHDYTNSGLCRVRDAVDEFVAARGLNLEVHGCSWMIRK